MSTLTQEERIPVPCGVPWCRADAYPGSQWCQFHEVVNPFDDETPPHIERAIAAEGGEGG